MNPTVLLRLALICAFVAVPLRAQDVPDPQTLAAAAERLMQTPEAAADFATCPGQGYASRQSLWSRLLAPQNGVVSVEVCADDMETCIRRCLERNEGKSCFQLGRVFETKGGEAGVIPKRHAFARGCALGHPASCTNRAAAARNTARDEDPLSQLPANLRDACFFSAFDTACAAGDSWGCAMSGQAHLLGEGTPVDKARARALFIKTCDMVNDTSFASCQFADSLLQGLESP